MREHCHECERRETDDFWWRMKQRNRPAPQEPLTIWEWILYGIGIGAGIWILCWAFVQTL